MAWAHVLSKSSAMGNPHEYRELMKAAFGFTDKTTQEVIAMQAARHEAARKEVPKKGKGAKTVSAPTPSTPKASELAKLQAILDMGKPRQPAMAE